MWWRESKANKWKNGIQKSECDKSEGEREKEIAVFNLCQFKTAAAPRCCRQKQRKPESRLYYKRLYYTKITSTTKKNVLFFFVSDMHRNNGGEREYTATFKNTRY